MKKILKMFLFVFLLTCLILFSALTYFYVSVKNVKFDDKALKKFGIEMEIYDGEGITKYSTSFNGKDYESNIPQSVKNAFVAVEDKRFYKHNGLDYKRMLSAFLKNIKSRSYKQGGSTISQQLIKNTLLSSEKTLKRKFAEIKLTKILESKYSKDEIITLYLNSIYFGENCYGIKSASRKYFDKEVSELTINESAMLAGIVKAPSKYNPIADYEVATKRKNLVLSLMQEQGYITKNQEKKLKNEEISIKNNTERYFSACKKEVDELLNEYYFKGKIKVYTNLDTVFQEKIENITYDYDSDFSYVVLDNKTGAIKAYHTSCLNLKRNPASTVKPLLVYAPCLEENLVNLQTKILDEPTNFNGYSPKNYNDKYYGYVSVKESLCKSLNVPSVKLLSMLGTKKAISYAQKMNLNVKNEDLSIALGNIENGVSLIDLTACYTVFSNDGKFLSPYFVEKIENEKGDVIYRHKNNEKKVFSEETVYLINNALMEATKNGSSRLINGKNYQICAKTGTNGTKKGNFDAYSISYTTQNTVGVWLGNKNNSLMDNSVSGSSYPTKINSKIMDIVNDNSSPPDFNIPQNIITVKLDKTIYENSYELALAENDDNFFEGIFKKGTEPVRKQKGEKPFIKNIKITCNNCDFSLFYDLENADGSYLYFKKENKKTLFKEIAGNSFKTTLKEGEYSFIIVPYKEKNGKKIKGKEIELPIVKAKKEYNQPNDWWLE